MTSKPGLDKEAMEAGAALFDWLFGPALIAADLTKLLDAPPVSGAGEKPKQEE